MVLISCPPVYHLPGTWTKCKGAVINHLNLTPGQGFAVFMGLLVVALMIYGIYMTFGKGGKDLRDEIDEHSKMHELGIAHGHSPRTKHK
tara:strand:- start:141 stop:407 length:267 start_codon:yes stop_codon:yes gene_type:complete